MSSETVTAYQRGKELQDYRRFSPKNAPIGEVDATFIQSVWGRSANLFSCFELDSGVLFSVATFSHNQYAARRGGPSLSLAVPGTRFRLTINKSPKARMPSLVACQVLAEPGPTLEKKNGVGTDTIAVARLLKEKKAKTGAELEKLATALHKDHELVFSAYSFGDNPRPVLQEVLDYVNEWPEDWAYMRVESAIFYLVLSYGPGDDLDKVFWAANEFSNILFNEERAHDYIFAIKTRFNRPEVHLMVNRFSPCDPTLTFRKGSEFSYERLREVMTTTASNAGLCLTLQRLNVGSLL